MAIELHHLNTHGMMEQAGINQAGLTVYLDEEGKPQRCK